MKRVLVSFLALLFISLLVLFSPESNLPVEAVQDPQPTVSYLETRVAELESVLTPTPTVVAGIPTLASEPPIELAPGLELTQYRFVATGTYGHEPGGDTTALLGVMRNTTDQDLDAVGIRFTLFDSEGNIVGDISASPLFLVIPAGSTMPFENGIFGDEPTVGSWDSEQIEICGTWPSTDFVERVGLGEGLEFREVVEEARTDDQLVISGKVYNGTDQPVENVWIRTAVYDSEGWFSGSDWTVIDLTIPVGKTAPFTIGDGLSPIDEIGIAGPGYFYTLSLGFGSSFGAC